MQNMSFYDKVNNIHARIFLKFHYKKIMSYLPWLANSIAIFSRGGQITLKPINCHALLETVRGQNWGLRGQDWGLRG